jgi:hypothetical protein
MTQTRVRDLPGWPPSWAASLAPGGTLPIGEIGVLQGVDLDPPAAEGPGLELTIEHDGQVALGVWPLASLDLSAVLYALLLEYVGRPLDEIGALPVPP